MNFKSWSNIRKLVVFIVAQVVAAANDGFIPAEYTWYVRLALFFVGGILLYAAKNETPDAASAVSDAAAAAKTVADGDLPSLEELEKQWAEITADAPAPAAAKHEAPEPAAPAV